MRLANGPDMARQPDAGVGKQLPCDGTRCHAGRRFTGARSLENVANVVASVLRDTGEIRMAGTRPRHGRAVRTACVGWYFRFGVQRALRFRPHAILIHHRDRTTDAMPGPDAPKDPRTIRFNLHPPAAAVPALTTTQLGGDSVDVDSESVRDAFEDHDEGTAVRLAGGEEAH